MVRGVAAMARKTLDIKGLDVIKWLTKQLSRISADKITQDLHRVSNIVYKGHTWSALKEIVLGYWVGLYTRVMQRQMRDWCRGYYYIDLLAGPGIVQIKETGDIILGSPLVAYFLAYRQFSGYILVDRNEKVCSALRARMLRAGVDRNRLTILSLDCNDERVIKVVREILEEEGRHALVFIDPEGFEIKWTTVEELLKLPCDLIIVFQTHMLRRTQRKADTDKILNEFFGTDKWRDLSADDCLKLYMKRLKGCMEEYRGKKCSRQYRAYVRNIKISGTISKTRLKFEYDIILACKEGEYVSVWDYLKGIIEGKDSTRIVEIALEAMKGNVTLLDELTRPTQTKITQWLNPDGERQVQNYTK